jgi:hypothetical protein
MMFFLAHEEMKQTALKRDEEQVQAIVNHLNETMTDPFDIEAHPPCLMNISTGMHATREVQDYLLSATSSLLLAKIRARLKTISGLI